MLLRALLLALFLPGLAGAPARAGDPLRLAIYGSGLARDGPGLLLRDIERGDDPDVRRAIAVIRRAAPDVLVLTGFDYDYDLRALGALARALRANGLIYPERFALQPNSGIATGLDLDRDGRLGTARDAQGYGRFAGQGGLAILSRYRVDRNATRDFSRMLWRDFPGAKMPLWPEGLADARADAVQRLSSVAHWDVVLAPDGAAPIHLLIWHATTPAFDGPQDRNGKRNADENRFWLAYLDGKLAVSPPRARFALLGDANLDPERGDGARSVIARLLNDPRLQDPAPRGRPPGAAAPSTVTANWPGPPEGPGPMRVEYVLPSRDLEVLGSGVVWPSEEDAASGRRAAHGLVWVDVRR